MMSTPITKEALIERGFDRSKYGYCIIKGENGVKLAVADSGVVQVGFLSNKLAVPNCHTMEQIDQIISLFTAP